MVGVCGGALGKAGKANGLGRGFCPVLHVGKAGVGGGMSWEEI